VAFFADVRPAGSVGKLGADAFTFTLTGGRASLVSFSVQSTAMDSVYVIVPEMNGIPNGLELATVGLVANKVEDTSTGNILPVGYPFEEYLNVETTFAIDATGWGN